MDKGLEILADVKREVGVPVRPMSTKLTNIADVAAVVDVLQTPASSAAKPAISRWLRR